MPHKLLTLLGLLALTPALAQHAPASTAAELLQRVVNPIWPGSETRTDVLPALHGALPVQSVMAAVISRSPRGTKLLISNLTD